MTTPTHNTATAIAAGTLRAAITTQHIIDIVDELTLTSAPRPAATVTRPALLTELRTAITPSLGSTGTGRGGNRLPIDTGALAAWEDIIGRIQALHIDLDGTPATKGSPEQILAAWARDLVAADYTAKEGLNQDALHLALRRVTRIRDVIVTFFDPPRTGDIPDQPCPACGEHLATQIRDGELEQMPALGTSYHDTTGMILTCRACDATWQGRDELEVLDLQIRMFRPTRAATAQESS